MQKRCVECYTIGELSDEARKNAVQAVLGAGWMNDLGQAFAHEDAVGVMEAHGWKVTDGPYYDLYRRGSFGLSADYVGGATDDKARALEQEAKAAGVDLWGRLTYKHYPSDHSVVDVEATPNDSDGELGDDEARAWETRLAEAAKAALQAATEAVRAQWDAVQSDEYVVDHAEANEILFTSEGRPCPI